MSDATFSLVTSMFTVGGFLGSSTANIVMERHGRKAAVQISGLFVAVGSGLMAIAPSTFLLLLGRQLSHSVVTIPHLPEYRFLTGCGAGIGLCTGPVFLAEIAPSNIRGSVGRIYNFHSHNLPHCPSGVLTQLAIVLGIMITQLLGLRMATPTLWRLVLLFSSVASVVQLCLSQFIVETPVWLKQNGKPEDSRAVQSFLFQEPGDPESICDHYFPLDQ
jgi:MFS family permease